MVSAGVTGRGDVVSEVRANCEDGLKIGDRISLELVCRDLRNSETGEAIEPSSRLASLLKAMLRRYGFECVSLGAVEGVRCSE